MVQFGIPLIFFINIFLICYCQITLPNQPIKEALFLHNTVTSNKTIRDCIFLNPTDDNLCPNEDIKFILYNNEERQVIDYSKPSWLKESIWDKNKEDVFIIHGYASGDDTLPIVVLRDAYINNSSYNVWMVDWGPLCVPPCYRGAVHNLRAVAKCVGELLIALKITGLMTDKLTCIGHSLGAHVCGLTSRAVTFKFHRIIGLDPARPLITPPVKLSTSDAKAVQVLHTNAGHYGERDKGGHVDFCINGGRIQPFCENIPIDSQLCSHIWAICYMAESLHPSLAKKAIPCSRRCPPPPRPVHKPGNSIFMGQHTPLSATGAYCLHENSKHPPYCPKNPGDIGDKFCCLNGIDFGVATTEMGDITTNSN